mmetsp:Transcript_86127/g.257001  ORF Transcript_86127/g.257001 Transcript_86127/m.257001 type:complete len:230 (+) Transcript_86127:86-775(+)
MEARVALRHLLAQCSHQRMRAEFALGMRLVAAAPGAQTEVQTRPRDVQRGHLLQQIPGERRRRGAAVACAREPPAAESYHLRSCDRRMRAPEVLGGGADAVGGHGCVRRAAQHRPLQRSGQRLREVRAVAAGSGPLAVPSRQRREARRGGAQRRHERVREGEPVEGGAGSPAADGAADGAEAQCGELRCRHQRVREGLAVAAGVGARKQGFSRSIATECCLLQCSHQCL